MKKISDYSYDEIELCLGENFVKKNSIEESRAHLADLIESGEAPALEAQPYRFVDSTRFGYIKVKAIIFRDGILGFDNLTEWALMDICDSTSIFWLQSLQDEKIALPLYPAEKLSGASGEYYVLTIPVDITRMTVNKKAPIVVNGSNGFQEIRPEGNTSEPVYRELKSNAMNREESL